MKRKPILCVDFDGVLHSYISGWRGADLVSDPPVPGAMEFLEAAVEQFEVHIFSSRSGQEGGIQAMKDWLMSHLLQAATCDISKDPIALYRKIVWPTEKPPALVTLDDRAITFTGVWPDLNELAAFKPWNKR